MSKAARIASDLPGWLLVITLVYAPWAMGGVPTWSVRGLNLLSGATLLAWGIGWLAGGARPPRVAPPLLVCVAWLLAQGWWMSVNAPTRYDPAAAGGFVPATPPFPAAPGAVDGSESRLLMLRLGGILGLACLACDVGRRPAWRRRLWWAAVLAGGSVALFGLIQRLAPVAAVARQMERYEGAPFATFNYHGAAGAFINLIIPPAAGLFFATLRGPRSRPAARILAPAALVACVAASFVNVSKAAVLIAVLLLGVVAVSLATGTRATRRGAPDGMTLPRVRRRRPAVTMLLVVLGVVIALSAAGTGQLWGRWRQYLTSRGQGGPNPRVLVWRIGWAMAEEAGALGYGPGSFKLLFPHSPHMILALYPRWIVHEHTPGGRVSIWSQAHQDYLQAVIEWGWVGAAAWAGFVAGGLWGLARATRRPGPPAGEADRILAFCALMALAGVFVHATMDFPLQIASIQLYVAVYLGLGWAADGGGTWGAPRSAPRPRAVLPERPSVAPPLPRATAKP